jgi:hypothetical protein
MELTETTTRQCCQTDSGRDGKGVLMRRYRLRLECEDEGKRVFESEHEHQTQQNLERAIVYDIWRALESTFLSPPSAVDLAAASTASGPLYGLGLAYDAWAAENEFMDNVRIIVDVDSLLGDDATDEDKDECCEMLQSYGIEVKRCADGREPKT